MVGCDASGENDAEQGEEAEAEDVGSDGVGGAQSMAETMVR